LQQQPLPSPVVPAGSSPRSSPRSPPLPPNPRPTFEFARPADAPPPPTHTPTLARAQIYIKHAVDHVKFDTNWGRVYYANLLGCIPLIFIGGGSGEAAHIVWSANGIIALSVSCVFGCAMSYFAFLARSLVSATSFTVLGTVCKLATVAINVMMWDNHASPFGLACLGSTLFSAYFYRQSPLRQEYQAVSTEGGEDEDGDCDPGTQAVPGDAAAAAK
jgi:hypothetical protein